jgi:hypothetical protein
MHGPVRTTYQDEFAFSTERIYKNFSNYSAFHHRTTYAAGYLREAGIDARDFVRQELEMVQQAIFTEPDDQTAWWCVSCRVCMYVFRACVCGPVLVFVLWWAKWGWIARRIG